MMRKGTCFLTNYAHVNVLRLNYLGTTFFKYMVDYFSTFSHNVRSLIWRWDGILDNICSAKPLKFSFFAFQEIWSLPETLNSYINYLITVNWNFQHKIKLRPASRNMVRQCGCLFWNLCWDQPTNPPRYRLQEGSWPNHKNTIKKL